MEEYIGIKAIIKICKENKVAINEIVEVLKAVEAITEDECELLMAAAKCF